MPISEEDANRIVEDLRAANQRFRAVARDEIAAEYEKLQSMPKRERLTAMKKRAEDAKNYLFHHWPASDEENAKLASENLRVVLGNRFGEVSDDELRQITAKVQRAIDHDRHEELRSIMKAAGASSSKTHAPRTKIGV